MKTKIAWQVSDISNPEELPGGACEHILEFQDNKKGWHNFEIVITAERVVFGGSCNAGFLESGYILRDESESIDETLSELLQDLEVYYNDGPDYTSRIVCNERM